MEDVRRASPFGLPPTLGVRAFLWFVAIGNVVLGAVPLVLGVAMLVAPDEDTWNVGGCLLSCALGVGWIAGAVGFQRLYVHRFPEDERSVAVETVYGRPAIVVQWRRTLLLVPMLTVGFLAAVFGAMTIALALQRSGGTWFVGVLTLLFTLYLPDSAIKATRHCRLVLTPEGIGADGWDGDSWLGWDDVASTEFFNTGSYKVLRVHGPQGARSWRWSRRRRVLFVPQPRTPRVDVPGPVLDIDPGWLAEVIGFYVRTPPARSELANELGRRRLVERPGPVITAAQGTFPPV
ncbi:hypothetical protein [Cellulomonas sp. URHD0024]|uniref:hypothetical protein n=1 Tax=Cellulomonas sp. URHD0024 TaxID=1302620 RepID=UPI0012DDB9A4|nr:hypothetical protein [Cellulomonas sp. URHD0024]